MGFGFDFRFRIGLNLGLSFVHFVRILLFLWESYSVIDFIGKLNPKSLIFAIFAGLKIINNKNTVCKILGKASVQVA